MPAPVPPRGGTGAGHEAAARADGAAGEVSHYTVHTVKNQTVKEGLPR
jgi:hypothetical protein